VKAQFKELLRAVGLWYPLLHVRQGRAVMWWITEGCPSPAPHVVKLYIVLSYCRRFALRRFIETGTYLGETTEWMARTGIEVVSIELADHLYERAQARLGRYPAQVMNMEEYFRRPQQIGIAIRIRKTSTSQGRGTSSGFLMTQFSETH
jgi:hypothetical protein